MNSIKQALILCAVTSMLAGCQQQTDTDKACGTADGIMEVPVTLTLHVKSGLTMASPASRTNYDSNLNTAPRQLILWHAEQAINDMRVYVFQSETADGEYIYAGGGDCADGAYKVPEFCNKTPWCPNLLPDDQYETHLLTFKPALKKGTYYKFLAIGRDDGNCEVTPLTKSFVEWGKSKVYSDMEIVPGVTRITDVKLSNRLDSRHYPYVSTEIFSGVMTYEDADGKLAEDYIYVDDDAVGFEKHIILNRAVAGLWVYLTDIPTKATNNTGDYLDYTFNTKEISVFMPKAAAEVNLYSYDGKDVKTVDERAVGYVDFNNIYPEDFNTFWHSDSDHPFWQHKALNDYLGLELGENCALMTNFILPLDTSELSDGPQSTLTLHLRQTEGPVSQFICNIKCHIETITDAKTGETRPYNGDQLHFPIVANCIYALGSPDNPLSLASLAKPESRSDEIPTIDMGITIINW